MGDRIVTEELLAGSGMVQKPHNVTCARHMAAAIFWGVRSLDCPNIAARR
jgi:hypothetical protein